jgi:predicted alpha/beta-fold hydrolase
MLQSVLPEGMGANECQFREDDGSVLGDAANSEKDFLLLVAGLGGGSDDSYVRSMGVAAVQSGRWQVGVVNMRGCGKAPVLSPRFFSAFRGATDDVRVALTYVRQHLRSGNKVAVVGWSNGATILNNALAEQASTHKEGRAAFGADAGVTLACPLNMPFASANLKRWFHASVYDRAIARSLSSKVSEYRHLFQDEYGAMKPVPAWEGLGEVGTKGAGSAGSNYVADEIIFTDTLRTIRSIDEAVTRR